MDTWLSMIRSSTLTVSQALEMIALMEDPVTRHLMDQVTFNLKALGLVDQRALDQMAGLEILSILDPAFQVIVDQKAPQRFLYWPLLIMCQKDRATPEIVDLQGQ